MKNSIFIEEKEIFYEIAIRRNTRRISLKIFSSGNLKIILPREMKKEKIEELILQKKNWILRHLAYFEKRNSFFEADYLFKKIKEGKILYHGNYEMLLISYEKNRKKAVFLPIEKNPALFTVSKPFFEVLMPEKQDYQILRDTVIAGLKKLAKKELTELAEKISQITHITFKDIKIKDAKTRWGSCSSKKNINLSWRLIMAPIEAQTYVILHELCHIYEMNHSHRFWEWIKKFQPNYKEQQEWFKKEGWKLHTL